VTAVPSRQRIAVAAAAALAAFTGGPAAARPPDPPRQRVAATAADLFNLAMQLARRGAVERVATILRALANDPDPDIRNEARFRHSKLLAGEGLTTEAAVLLRRILDDRPGAIPVRLELARLLDGMGDKEGAWRQMRSVQSAGLPPAVARLIDRYSEALRAQRPFGASFEIALAPDSNINRATRSDTLGTVLGDFRIDEASKAKSGTGLSLNAQAYHRIQLGEGPASLLFSATGNANLYKAKAFNEIVVDVVGGPEIQVGQNRLNVEIGATQRWFGQKAFARSARLASSWSRPIGRRSELRLKGSAALVDNRLNDLQDGRSYSAQLGLEHALSPEMGVAVSLGVDRESLKDAGYSSTGWRGGVTAWRDIGRMTLTAGVEIGRLNADERLMLFPDKRSDRYSRLSFGATFRQLQFRGFAPVARFSLERNRSTIEFYDYRRDRTEVGVVRAF
jgi:hypothetical protein